jgi:cathepsin B
VHITSAIIIMLSLSFATLSTPSVHPERAAMIEQLKATPGLSWMVEAHPRFASSPPGEALAPLMGVRGDWKKALDDAKAAGEVEEFVVDPNLKVPDSFDAAENWPSCAKMINDIRDQSACGCCWAFAGAEAASDRMCIATNASVMMPLSAQDLCFCGAQIFSHGCNGGQINTPWDHIKRLGAVSGGQFNSSGPFGAGMCSDFSLPHCHHHGPKGADPYPAEGTPGCPQVSRSPKCPGSCDASSGKTWKEDKYSFKGKVQSASGEAAIQQMLMTGGPVSTAFTVYSDFENYAGGIYSHTTGTMAGGHAVKFVGWGVENGKKYWKVANSWNPYWGEKGYFRIVRGDAMGNGGIENGVVAAAADAVWGKKSVLDAK